MEKEWEHVKELPPSVGLLFPIQPAPKIHCPTLIVEFGDKGEKQKITGPMVRSYTKQTWQFDPKGNEISKISWSYNGRKVNKNTPDAEKYEISWSGNEGGSSLGDIKRTVIYVGKTIKVLESNSLNITIEPSKLGAYPTKRVKEDEVLGAMLKRMENVTQGTRIWRQKNHTLAEIPSVYKISNHFLKWIPGENQHRKQIYDFGRKIETIIDNNYIAYYDIDKFFETNKTNLEYFFGNHFCLISDAVCEKTNEVFEGSNKHLIYNVYPFYNDQNIITEIKIWVEETTKLPSKVELFYPNGKSTISTFDWITHIPESEFSMAPPEGAKVENLELYQKKMGLLKSPKNSTNPPESPSANSKSNPLEKNSFLNQIQGDWVPVKQVNENLMEIDGAVKAIELWTIKENVFTMGGDLTKSAQLDPVAPDQSGQIDFLRLGSPPSLLVNALTQSHRAPSLWSLDGHGKLLVLIGTNGKRPEKLEPTQGCLYFELIRQNKTSLTPANGSQPQPPVQTAPSNQIPWYLERLFRKESSETPSLPKSATPSEKEEILKKLQGTWVIDKRIVQFGILAREEDNPGDTWTIEENTIKTLKNPGLRITLEIKSSTNPIRIDWIPPKEGKQNRGEMNASETLVPSLWEQSGDKLKVVMAPNGKLPEKVESAPDCAYFELSRKRVSPKSPSKPTSPPPDKNGETEKEEILKHLQGNWVIEKQIILKDKGERIQEKAGDAWTIEGNTLRSWNRPDLHNTLEIKTTRPQIRIDLVSPNRDRTNNSGTTVSETQIPSLWERSGEKLKVLLAPGGKLPEKIEPTLDCIYFELARKPKSETTQLGFPTRFQGKWKVTRMVGPDQKDGQLNLGETVTIDPGILWIGDQIKKAELVDTGSFLKGNLVSTVISPKDGSKNEVRIVSLWELTENKIRFVNGVEIPTKVEPGIGCFYYEMERIENAKPNGDSPTLSRPASSDTPRVEVRKEKPGSEGTNLVFYRKKTDGVDRIVRSLPRHHYGFDQPRKTEEVVVSDAQFSVTWKWGKGLPLVPGPDAELLDLEVLKSGDPVSKTIYKQVYLVGHPVTIHRDDNFTLVLEPVTGFLPATKKITEVPELAAMLDKVKKMESVSWENHGVGLFRDADVIFCCQKKGLLRYDEYRDKKWLRSMVLHFPKSKILSLDSDQKVPRSEGTLDATSLHLQNLFVVFEDMATDHAILLGQETVKGKPCNFYRIQSNSPYQKTYQDRYLWVDTTTQLPIVIRCTAKESLGVFTYRQFLWNLPLGDDHFLLDRTKEKLPEPGEKPKTEVAPAPIKTEVKDPKSTLKAPDKKTNTKP